MPNSDSAADDQYLAWCRLLIREPFECACGRIRLVLASGLGHQAQVAVSRPDPSRHALLSRSGPKVGQVLVNAAIIPIRFGSSVDAGSPGIRTWTDEQASNGVL